jgi:hypothetical protein
MAIKEKVIKLSDLQINTENYRFEPLESEDEALDYMIADQKEYLLFLAKDISEKDLNPFEKIVVYPSPSHPGKYRVLEGNRRVIALKLLHNPSLIRGKEYTALKTKFKKFKEKLKSSIKDSLKCSLCADPTEVEYWIALKHGHGITGVGTESWGPLQKYRFREKTEGKSAMVLQLIKKVKDSPYFPDELKKRLKELKTTNLDRLISDPDVRTFLGIEIEKGNLKSQIKEEELMKGISRVIEDLLNPDFNVKKIYSKEERKNYLKKFPKDKKPDKTLRSKKTWFFNEKSTVTTSSKNEKLKPYPKERKTLIPKSCILKIKNPRINKIYYELSELDVQTFTNSSAVLFRVFIELSLDEYLEKKNITKANRDSFLRVKVNEVANDLEKRGIDKYICKGIRTAANTKDDLLGIDTLNAYIHNDKFSPSTDHLLITWNNVQPFIEKVWETINKK